MSTVQAKKTGFILMIVHAIHNFSVWLKTGSNPPDINPFLSDTRKS